MIAISLTEIADRCRTHMARFLPAGTDVEGRLASLTGPDREATLTFQHPDVATTTVVVRWRQPKDRLLVGAKVYSNDDFAPTTLEMLQSTLRLSTSFDGSFLGLA